jgi:hypothetical protein
MDEAANEAQESTRRELERKAKALNSAERRVLDLLWDQKRREVRKQVPLEVLYFLESDKSRQSNAGTDVHLIQLEKKGYVSTVVAQGKRTILQPAAGHRLYDVTPQGVAFLKDKHPAVLAYWEKLLQLTPPTVSLAVAAIGLLASVAGLIQFGWWVHDKFLHLPLAK